MRTQALQIIEYIFFPLFAEFAEIKKAQNLRNWEHENRNLADDGYHQNSQIRMRDSDILEQRRAATGF